jgi:hypothetical protein
MSLSTLFRDPKVASNVGGLLMIVPTIFFLQFIQFNNNLKNLIYFLYFIPITPALTLFLKQSENT